MQNKTKSSIKKLRNLFKEKIITRCKELEDDNVEYNNADLLNHIIFSSSKYNGRYRYGRNAVISVYKYMYLFKSNVS